MRDAEPQAVRLADYRPPEWLVDQVDLDFALHPTQTRVTARLALRRNPKGTPGAPVILDGDGLTLVRLAIDGAPLAGTSFEASPERLVLRHPPADAFTLEIETLVDPTANTQLMGLYRTSNNYCTQCEPEGFRRITYFPDRPDVLAVYTTRIEAEAAEAPVLLGNGNLVSSGPVLGTSRHFAVWHDPWPKPSYLFALVGGKLARVADSFTTASGRQVELGIYVEEGKETRAGYAMDALKRSMRWDETAFGREYDLDVFNIVAVSDFNMGAMENKGLNVFNDKYVLASPQTATDADYSGIEGVIAHEYFHNWTGNRITCRDWFQLCLKEGLTVFRDQEFSSDQRSRPVKRISDVRMLKAAQFTEDSGPLAHPVRPETYREINNFYTATVYEKGSEVVRMLKTLLGEEGFRKGMDLYFARHDGEAATIEDFLAAFADATGRDLTQFALWYAQSGTPTLEVKGAFDAAAGTYRLDVKQSVPPTPGQSEKKPMVIPLALGLVGPDGADLPLTLGNTPVERGVVEVTEREQSFLFTGLDAKPVPSLNRGFSAPVNVKSDLTPEDRVFLAAHDRDPFNRFDALQGLALGLLAKAARGKVAEGEAALIDAARRLLTDAALDPAFKAQALALPGESEIARELGGDVDPDGVFAARKALRLRLGAALAGPLVETYAALGTDAPFAPDAASAGRRALRNLALDYLAAAGSAEGIARAEAQFAAADNMTDRMAALAVLAQHDRPERGAALDAFYARFESDALVIDKWFTLQAQIPEAGTLERVKALMLHPAFSMGNPNRVRALVGAFAATNPTQFNRADGAGHAFLADVVLSLDARNPQVASRLLSAFKTWRQLEPGRRGHAEAALRRVADTPGLSPDVADIATRSLG
ncbi:aminopeptidase N [Xanthobacter tagetidis]|uniref:Aminopeptidase N n=1 Tax=Xanthobacter tagetidis TaxID=60216 RepID=A0A3L7AFR9_9HYPH|nr:aminopeptidase N [Xanthobacter tagetidis]MBB6305975.1 aminopeptidase N [Xanthobacter tagetidis]RLP78491.1 aminopeptidase N [Xanthobacter tagetidis]